jgi:type I restriction enzyme, S subunit
VSVNWPEVPLSEAMEPRTERPSEDDLLSGRVKIVSKISFDSGRISFREDGETKTGMILAQPGDLLVSGINAYKGAIAIYDSGAGVPAAATIHYSAYGVRKERADARFIWWLLRSQIFRNRLEREIPGGIKTELKPARLLPVHVPLPAVPEQKRIVARIEELSRKIEEARELKFIATAQAESLFLSRLVATRRALFRRTKASTPIGRLTDVVAGGTPSRANFAYWEGTIPWVKTGELLDGDITRTGESITEEGLTNSSAKLLPQGTVLVALYGQGQTRGRTGLLKIRASTNQACCGILPHASVEPKFVQYWIRSLYAELREEVRAGAQPNWNSDTIKRIQLPILNRAEQNRVVESLGQFEQEVASLIDPSRSALQDLEALLPSVVAKALAGEL